ncbi:MAG: response regulator, partial [Rhodoplanes sp.]
MVLDELGVYRKGLCALISTQMPQAQVLAAKSLIEALPQIQNGVFDLVLLGLDLSNSEMVDTLKVAREASAATRFAIISASDTRADILATLAAGLHGFISKHQSDTEILTAINDILSGRIYVPCSLAEAGDSEAS